MKEESLEARVSVLEYECQRLADIEAIRMLRYRYCRSVHRGEWRELEACFAEDSTIDFGPERQFSGREAVVGFYENVLSRTMAMTLIYCHNPLIEVRVTTATGLWEFENFRVESESNEASRIGGAYEEEYVKVDGAWKIRRTAVASRFRQPVQYTELGI